MSDTPDTRYMTVEELERAWLRAQAAGVMWMVAALVALVVEIHEIVDRGVSAWTVVAALAVFFDLTLAWRSAERSVDMRDALTDRRHLRGPQP